VGESQERLMSKVNRTGRARKAPRHVRLYYWMTNAPAWHDMGALERAIYSEIAKRYDGSNNGRIGYSIRTAAGEFRVGLATVHRAFQSLVGHGFLVAMQKGGFSLKRRHATEWRLTEFPCDVTHNIASKDFMRWQPAPKIQNTVSVAERKVSVAETVGICSGTVNAENGPDGICSGNKTANFSISRYPQRNTCKLPGGGEPVGKPRREAPRRSRAGGKT
jgi:hypothetical protein